MQMLVLAFPEQPINLTILSDLDLADESNRQVAKEQVWHADLCPTAKSLKDKYSVDVILVCGPVSYTEGIARQLSEYFENDLDVNVVIVPSGDKLETPEGAERRTEGGLIL